MIPQPLWEIYAYNVVTFGDQIAGLILELVKSLAAQLGEEIDLKASNQIQRITYVDDGAGGGSREKVEKYRGKLVNGKYDGTIPRILALVGLDLTVMVSSGDQDPKLLSLMGDKLLGHKRRPGDDKLVFKVGVSLSASKQKGQNVAEVLTQADIPRLPSFTFTKRMLLGMVMSQYDPMGLICPLTIILKISLHSLYGSGKKLGWDEPIPQENWRQWVEIISKFLGMEEIVLDRAVKPEGTTGSSELIGFADGSLEAYACAIYVRWRLEKSSEDQQDFFVR